MADDTTAIEQINSKVQDYHDFISDCILSLRNHVESSDYNVEDDMIVRKKINEGIEFFRQGQIDQASVVYSDLLENWLYHLARPESKDLADNLFYYFQSKNTFDDNVKFRLHLIFVIHDLSVSNQPQRIEIAKRLLDSHQTSFARIER